MSTDSNVLHMLFSSGPVVKAVLITLIALSVWTWAVVIAKIFQLKKAVNESKEFSNLFWETKDFEKVDDSSQRLKSNPLAKVFSAGYRELVHIARRAKDTEKTAIHPEQELKMIERALERAEFEEVQKLNSGTTFLATVASAAPFIGLFGTVWGIMTAFQGLSAAKSATIQAVAPGISEALIATAIGLAAAIPAAIAYNYFSASIRDLRNRISRFNIEFVNLAERYFTA